MKRKEIKKRIDKLYQDGVKNDLVNKKRIKDLTDKVYGLTKLDRKLIKKVDTDRHELYRLESNVSNLSNPYARFLDRQRLKRSIDKNIDDKYSKYDDDYYMVKRLRNGGEN